MASQSNVGRVFSNWNIDILVYSSLRGAVLIRLYLIGVMMGIADLIPGVSGGTVALMSGIYEQLLESIKSLQFQSIKKIAWSFFLPLGAGIITAVFLCARFIYYLMLHYPVPLFSFFLGLIVASALLYLRKINLKRGSHWITLLFGVLIAYLISGMHERQLQEPSMIYVMSVGILAALAMLLPGISGCYMLQLFGIYPFAIAALNTLAVPSSLKLLIVLTFGVAIGFVIFSRMVSWLLLHLSGLMFAALIGFMLGGTRCLWPYYQEDWLSALLFTFLGFFLIIAIQFQELSLDKRQSSHD